MNQISVYLLIAIIGLCDIYMIKGVFEGKAVIDRVASFIFVCVFTYAIYCLHILTKFI